MLCAMLVNGRSECKAGGSTGYVGHKGSYGMACGAQLAAVPEAVPDNGPQQPRRCRVEPRTAEQKGGGPQSRRRSPNHAATAFPTVDTGEAARHRLRISQHPGRPLTMSVTTAGASLFFECRTSHTTSPGRGREPPPTRAPHSSFLSSQRGRPTRRSRQMPARRNSARATASGTIVRNSAGEPPAIVKRMKSCVVSWQHQQNIDRSSAVTSSARGYLRDQWCASVSVSPPHD